MNKSLLLHSNLLFASPAIAQTASPGPAAYSFKARADYDHYAPQITETVNWLEASTLPTDNPQRREANG